MSSGRAGHVWAALAVAVLVGIATVLVASVSAWLGSVRSGYKPLIMSMSVLGERGSDRSELFDLALVLLGVVLILAGVTVRHTAPGGWIGLAGAAMVAVALVPIDPRSSGITLVHRALTACVLVALVLAAFSGTSETGWFSLASKVVRWLAPVGLLLGAGLLFEGFPGGVWERAMFSLLMVWVELYLIYLVQESARTSVASAAS